MNRKSEGEYGETKPRYGTKTVTVPSSQTQCIIFPVVSAHLIFIFYFLLGSYFFMSLN